MLGGKEERWVMVKCPFCGYEADASKLKPLRSPWKFRFYEVKMYECPRCHNVFNHYFGVSPRTNRASEFVIRARPRIMTRPKRRGG